MTIKTVVVVFSCSLLLALLSTLHTLSIIQNNILFVMLLEFLNPLLNVLSLRAIIVAEDLKGQLKIAVIIGSGYALGSTIGLLITNN